MSSSSRSLRGTGSDSGRIDRLNRHLRDPLHRNGYLLATSSVLSSGLGVVYWWLAARLFEPEAVGIGSAAISAMILLANLASFNLVNGLNRFVPRAGQRTAPLIALAYAVAALAGAVAGLIFLAGLQWWSPSLGILTESPGMAAWFVVAVAAWALFVLQDGVLTGLRAAGWVTTENLIYSGLKILALVLVASWFATTGVFVAWTVPLIPLVIVVNGLIFRRLLPVHATRGEESAEPISLAIVGRFVLGDYSASLVWMATTNVLPIIVLELAGPAPAAYFFLAWTVSYVLYLVGRNFSMSMLTEAALTPSRAGQLTFRTMRQTALLLVPAVVLVVVAAPLILSIFGEDYSTEGADLLRLLALASLPGIVTTAYVALLRAQRRMKAMLIFTLAMSVAVLPLSWVLLETTGIVGVGVAWLIAHVVAAVVLAATELREVFVAHLNPALLGRLGRVRDLGRRRLGGRAARAGADSALAELSARGAPVEGWRPVRVLTTITDARLVTVGPEGGAEAAIVKLGASGYGTASLQRAAAALDRLGTDDRLASWRHLAPEMVGSGRLPAGFFLVERMINGVNAEQLARDAEARTAMVMSAAAVARHLGDLTPGPRGGASGWFEDRLGVVRDRLQLSGRPDLVEDLDRLGVRLGGAVAQLPSSMVHGDFWLGNLLVDPTSFEVVGVLDWDASVPQGPVDLDLVSMMTATRVLLDGQETGPAVVGLLNEKPWTEEERAVLSTALDPEWASSSDALRVAWLHGVALVLEQSERYQPGSPWFLRNVLSVLPDVAG